MALDVRVEPVKDGEAIVRVAGELDMASAEQLRHAVTHLLNAGKARVIGLDLRDLTFLDSTGIGTLVVAQRISRHVGVELRLIAVSAFATHVLNIAGVGEALGVAEAVAATNAAISAR
jgi:anti-sigma B factor antagonist